MSQPPPKSPTPSKSSLRRTSSIQNPSQRSLVPSPSPRFDENPAAPIRYSPRSPPNQTLDYESDDDEDALIGANEVTGAEDGSLFPTEAYNDPPHLHHPFQPFFTLIEDGLTSEHHHPSVHYIFADDDTELITEAALRSLEQDELTASSTADKAHGQDDARTGGMPHHEYEPESEHEQEYHRRLPPPAPGVKEHYLILDVCPVDASQQAQTPSQSQTPTQPHPATSSAFGYTVKGFASLSPEWQISSASITSAPTMGENTGEDEGLMLRIEGRGHVPLDDIDAPERGQRPSSTAVGQTADERDPTARGKEKESLEDMIERFQSRLGEVRKLIEIDPNTLAFGADAGTGIGLGVANPYRDNTGTGGGDGVADFTPGSYGLGVGIGTDAGGESSGDRDGYGLEEQD